MIIWYILGGIIVLALIVELAVKDNKYIKFERTGQLIDEGLYNSYLVRENREASMEDKALVSLSSLSEKCNQLEKTTLEAKDKQGEMSAAYYKLNKELDTWEKKYLTKNNDFIEKLINFEKPLSEIIKWHSLNWRGTKEFEESEKYLSSNYAIQKRTLSRHDLDELINWRKTAAIELIKSLPNYKNERASL